MKAELSQVRWGRVLLTGVLVAILSSVLLYLVIAVYAASLAIQARGQPDQAQIAQFVNQVAPWGGPILAILLTIGGAVWVARKVASGATLHGFLVGLVAALIILIFGLAFGGRLDLVALLTFVLMVAAGWLGGVLGSRGREKSEPSGNVPS
jgi:putative membrane protein (TIGR04086 family)